MAGLSHSGVPTVLGNQKAYEQSPERPFKIAVEGEFGADEAHDDGEHEEHDECRDEFLEFLSLELHAGSEQNCEYAEGAEELDPEFAVYLCCKGFLFRNVLPEMPGAELESGEVECLGKDCHCSDCNDDESEPAGEPVLCFPELGQVGISTHIDRF